MPKPFFECMKCGSKFKQRQRAAYCGPACKGEAMRLKAIERAMNPKAIEVFDAQEESRKRRSAIDGCDMLLGLLRLHHPGRDLAEPPYVAEVNRMEGAA